MNIPAVVTFPLGLYAMEDGCLAVPERSVSVEHIYSRHIKTSSLQCHDEYTMTNTSIVFQ